MKKLQFEALEPRIVLSTISPVDAQLTGENLVAPSTNQWEQAVISVPFESITNFAHVPTATAINSGSWDDLLTWDTGIPQAADIVLIPPGLTVTINSPAQADAIGVAGVLVLESELTITNLEVYDVGVLNVLPGTEVVFRDIAPTDPGEFGTGLVVFGGFIAEGSDKDPYIRAQVDPRAGDITLTLETQPEGWKKSDELMLADTRQLSLTKDNVSTQWSQYETVRIASIDGAIVTLMTPLLYDHLGSDPFRIPVANLSRDVLFRSENPDGHRGHVLINHRSDIDLQFAEFKDLGRTTTEPVGPGNQNGRFSIHLHHLIGPTNPTNTGFQYELTGNVINSGLMWGLNVHDTSFGLINGNIVYDVDGAGIAFADSSEYRNEVVNNYIAKIDGNSEKLKNFDTLDDRGQLGNGMWISGPHNIVNNNIVSGARHIALYQFTRHNGIVARHPTERGQAFEDYTIIGNRVKLADIAFHSFANNEIFASSQAVEFYRYASHKGETTIAKDTKVWNTQVGYAFGADNNILIDGWVQRGNGTGTGIGGRAGGTDGITIRGADIRGMGIGISNNGTFRGVDFVVEDTYLDNATNFRWRSRGRSFSHGIETQDTYLRNVTYGPGVAIEADGLHRHATNIFLSTRLIVEDGAETFEVYFDQQDADFIIPDHKASRNHDVVGLTNQEAYDLKGISINGHITPENATTKNGIVGGVITSNEQSEPESHIIDNGDEDFTTTGKWIYVEAPQNPIKGFSTDIHHSHAKRGYATATWTFTDLSPGTYQVFATWNESSNRASNAQFTVAGIPNADGPITVNQQQTPNGDEYREDRPFQLLGGVTVLDALVVTLDNQANGHVIADAILIVKVGD